MSIPRWFKLLTAILCLCMYSGQTAKAHPEEPSEVTISRANNTEAFETGPQQAAVHCILVHGFAGSPLDFSELPTRLGEAGIRVSVLRLPHHGTTASSLSQATAGELVAAVEQAVLESNSEFDTTVVVGFSMGASISTIVASSIQVEKLVLIAPFFEVTHRWYFGLRAETWNAAFGFLIPYVPKTSRSVQVNRREAVPSLFSNSWLPTSAISTLVELGQEAGNPSTLSRVDSDVLVLHSPKDMAASQSASLRNFNLLGTERRRYIEMPNRNNHHLLSDWDRELAYDHILDFILSQD
jgi:carboxylesterase